jgi:hypothetical protein
MKLVIVIFIGLLLGVILYYDTKESTYVPKVAAKLAFADSLMRAQTDTTK